MHLSLARELGRDKGEGVREEVRWSRTRRDMRSSPMCEGRGVCVRRIGLGK